MHVCVVVEAVNKRYVLLFILEDLLLSHVDWKIGKSPKSSAAPHQINRKGLKSLKCKKSVKHQNLRRVLCVRNKLQLLSDGKTCSALIASALRQVCIYSTDL